MTPEERKARVCIGKWSNAKDPDDPEVLVEIITDMIRKALAEQREKILAYIQSIGTEKIKRDQLVAAIRKETP
jgi:type II secretory pathway component PulC